MMNIIYVAFLLGICISLTDAGSSCDTDKVNQCVNEKEVCKLMEDDIEGLNIPIGTGVALGDYKANATLYLCVGGSGYSNQNYDSTGNLSLIAVYKGNMTVDVKKDNKTVAKVEGHFIINITFVVTWDQFNKLVLTYFNSTIVPNGELKVTVIDSSLGVEFYKNLPTDIINGLNAQLPEVAKYVLPKIEGCLNNNNACSTN